MFVEGEIGILKQEDIQVAGVFDWHSRIVLDYTVRENVREYKPHKRMTARSYWLVSPLDNNEFEVELYKVMNDDLVMMDYGFVRVDLPDCKTINRRLDAPIDMTWLGYGY